jgi:DNA polymerase kappa
MATDGLQDQPRDASVVQEEEDKAAEAAEHGTLKYHLLGPSLTKAGQDTVDQAKACANLQKIQQCILI